MAKATITLEVGADLAKAFAQASEEDQKKLRLLLTLRLRELTLSGGTSLATLMDEIGSRAVARGLSPAILESLLREG